MPRSHKRGAVRKADSSVVSVWLPKAIVDLLDREVQVEDTDRSKVIRKALRKHFAIR